MTSRDLSPDQFKELCQRYITDNWTDSVNHTTAPAYDDLSNADELVDEEIIHNYYEGITFTNDDFFCTAGQVA
ncbi:MAG: hypothetical protein IJ341_02785 [Bacteroidales bacterium]|nr:hypothetical protein [Bacteroidales bacterium]